MSLLMPPRPRRAWIVVALAALALFAVPSQAQDKTPPKLNREELDKLFKDVPLPPGDPIPDFVEPPWQPPTADKGKMNKRGTDFGPALAFTVQLSKNSFVRRGLTVRLPDDHAVLYDLETLRVAATWKGGFLDLSETHFEDSKGKLPGRPGGPPTLWLPEDVAGWADANGSFADPRKNHLGPLPKEHIEYHGHFLHGYRTVLSYSVRGREVLEMPGRDAGAPEGCVSRTFYVGPGDAPLQIVLAPSEGRSAATSLNLTGVPGGGENPFLFIATGKGEGVVVGVVDAPPGSRLRADNSFTTLTLPTSADAVSFKVILAQGQRNQLERQLRACLKDNHGVADLRNYVRGGPRRWEPDVVTAGKVGAANGPYAVDTLTLPDANPWKAWLRPAALDFYSDGRCVVSSMNGDVWVCSGIDKSLKELHWRRFATGLYEPLGLKIVDDRLYVLGRDRITRLHDLNRDGEADFYQSFFAGGTVAPGYHAFTFDLQTDSRGNFYFVKSGRKADDAPDQNALVRVSPDGQTWEAVATGFRHPNGMGVGPRDEVVIGDNQGEFIPSSKINLVTPGKYYGYGKLDLNYARPLLWLPMKQDNSSGGQLWAPAGWGPLSGKMLHTSYGTCKLFSVLPQMDRGEPVLCSAVPLDALRFPSGVMRGRVNPADGQVYLSGLKGWGTSAKQDGCLNRVRYTGQPGCLIRDVTLVPGGLRLTFTEPLDPKAAADAKNYKLEQWNYIYSERYGSPEMSALHPDKKGHDTLAVAGVTVDDDGTAVTLALPGLRPVDQLHVALTLRDRAGRELVTPEVYATIHRAPGKSRQ